MRLFLGLLGIELRQTAKKAAKDGADALARTLGLNDTQPFPLTHKQVQHQQEQIRQATAHGSGMHRIERDGQLIPPPRKD